MNHIYLQLISNRSSIPLGTNILCKSGYFFIILSNFGCIWCNNTCKSLIIHGCTWTSTGCEWRCAQLRSWIAKISPAVTHSLIRFLFGVVEKSNFLLFFLGFYFGRGQNQWTKSKITWVGMWHGERLVRVGSRHWVKIYFSDDSFEITHQMFPLTQVWIKIWFWPYNIFRKTFIKVLLNVGWKNSKSGLVTLPLFYENVLRMIRQMSGWFWTFGK